MSISIEPEAYPYLAVIGVVIVIIIACIVMASKSSQKRAKARIEEQKKLKASGVKFQYSLTLFSGLNLPEKTTCKVSVCNNEILIEANGVEFVLKNDKILDVCLKTDVEIQKHYVSSVGGAVGGAVLFGPIGAAIGGRAKQKVDREIHHYLIFTYDKEGTSDYIGFDVTGSTRIANQYVTEFQGKTRKNRVEL